MTLPELHSIERELKKRHAFPYKWYQKQNDQWDGFTNFIYQTSSFEALQNKIDIVADKHSLDRKLIFQYAANRWYNFWSAKAIEKIFTEMDGIVPVIEAKDSEKDFYLYRIPFDHKTSVFPKQFNKNFEYAKVHRAELIEWLYKNQSSQKRYHLKNRLFIVVYNKDGEHWKLKAEITLLQREIEDYIKNYQCEKLHLVNFANGESALSDIIWVSN